MRTNEIDNLIAPFGGTLVDLLLRGEERDDIVQKANELPSIQLSERSLSDLEMLAVGGFSPVDRFMGKDDYLSVLTKMRLAGGTLFPIPITLPVAAHSGLREGSEVALRGTTNELMATMRIDEIFGFDPEEESLLVYGTSDLCHPLVSEMHSWGSSYVSGPLQVVNLPAHFDFPALRRSPRAVRAELRQLRRPNIVAFQTRNPMNRVHEEMTRRALTELDATLLLHPIVGLTKAGDVDHYTRIRTYRAHAELYCDPGRTLLSLLPLAARMAGPREALWHAIIRMNYGANCMIVGRDHASPGHDSTGRPFYPSHAAQQLVAEYIDELGMRMIACDARDDVPEEDWYENASCNSSGHSDAMSASHSEVRDRYLEQGKPLPGWLARPEVANILSHAFPPRHQQGFCIWFTGLPSSGKSTVAEVLTVMLMEHGKQVTLLDGDVVRTHLSRGLGFSKEDRDTNVLRIGFVASEIVRHKGTVICAAVSPYAATRNQARAMVGPDHFITVYMDTPVSVCEQRDRKGFYAKARAGVIHGFTGLDDPYEPPIAPEVMLKTTQCSAQHNAQRIIDYLRENGWLPSSPVPTGT